MITTLKMASNDLRELLHPSFDENTGDQENATPNNGNEPAGENAEAENENGGRCKLRRWCCNKKDKKRKWLPCFLRLSLFSPLKWKEDAFWCSFLHLVLFAVHVVKIVFLSILTFKFGTCRADVSTITNNRYVALHHLLLEKWDSGFETLPYPPSHGQFAVYTVDDLRSGINYTVSQFYNAENEATGNFKRTKDDNITINIQYHDTIKDIMHENKSRIVKKSCQVIPDIGLTSYINEEGQTIFIYNVTEDLIAANLQGILKSVFEVNLTFALHAVRVDYKKDTAVCHQIKGNVSFHDYNQDGQLALDLIVRHFKIRCAELDLLNKDSHQCNIDSKGFGIVVDVFIGVTIGFDSLIFIIGVVAMTVTCCCIDDGCKVEYLLNFNWWVIISIVGDGLCFHSIYNIIDETKHKGQNRSLTKEESDLMKLDEQVIYLGYGYLVTLLSSLRFLRINHKFSILFKTIRRSAPDIFFFLICVTVLFFGFWVSSLIVLGPYHTKFRTKSSAFETLFSLIHGDELYATLAVLEDSISGDREGIWLFSRVIVVGYVLLFTVFVFNLLIAMFNNAYETVKEEYQSKNKKKESTIADVSGHQTVQGDQGGSRDKTEGTTVSGHQTVQGDLGGSRDITEGTTVSGHQTVQGDQGGSRDKMEGTTVSGHQTVQGDQGGSLDITGRRTESSDMKHSLFTYVWSDVDETERCICPCILKCSRNK